MTHTYTIKPIDLNKNLIDMLKKEYLITPEIVIEKDLKFERFKIDLKKLNSELFPDLEQKFIRIEDNGIFYYIVGENDSRLMKAISSYFPNEIFSISNSFNSHFHQNFYYKNNQQVSKDGKPILASLYHINHKFFKENGDKFQIHIPIGEEPNKWGKIDIPKENIIYDLSKITNEKYFISIFFTEEMIDVTFPSGTIKMSSKDIEKKYYQALENYKEDMNHIIEIKNFPEDNLKKMTGYYIVKIPCSKTVSDNGFISTTIPEFNIYRDTVLLGIQGRHRNVILEKNGEKIRTSMKNSDIKKHYEDSIYNRIPLNEEINHEEDIPQDDVELE